MEDVRWPAEQLEEHHLEISNRIRNLFWTVSGDYDTEFEPDTEKYVYSKQTVLYEAVKQGAFARYFDQKKLGMYLMKKLHFSAGEDMLLPLQRFRNYEEPRETNERIFQFRAYANNRDGLALKTVCSSLMERPEKNKAYYGNNHWIIKRNISVLAESLKRAFIIRKDDFVSRSDAGQLVPERLWKIGRTDDDKLFNRKKRSEDSEFVIDVLIDSSGSQAGRQAQVAAQGYIISEALSQAGIPHRVTGYCAFWGYTVLQRFRDYEDPRETNERIFQFRAYANNRDGLTLKTVCSSLMERPEKNKILIVLSDGKPCDMSIQRPGTRQPKIYDGEKAVKDTAYEVRRARNQGIFVIGIFVGNEEELSVEKRIYGKDFAYIRNISNFSRMVGTFLRRQIDME